MFCNQGYYESATPLGFAPLSWNLIVDANMKARTVVRIVSKGPEGSGSFDPLPRAAVFLLVFTARKKNLPPVIREGKR